MSLKRVIIELVSQAWVHSFTTRKIMGSFTKTSIFSLDMTRVINKLKGKETKRKEPSFDHPPLADTSFLTSKDVVLSVSCGTSVILSSIFVSTLCT